MGIRLWILMMMDFNGPDLLGLSLS